MWKTNLIFSFLIVAVVGVFIHYQQFTPPILAKAKVNHVEVPVPLAVEKSLPRSISEPEHVPVPEPVKPNDVLQIALDYQREIYQEYHPEPEHEDKVISFPPPTPSIEILNFDDYPSADEIKKAQEFPGSLVKN